MTTSQKWSLILSAIVAVQLCRVESSFAATSVVNPSLDAFVTTGPSGNLSANNYGGGGGLALSASGLAKGEFQSVLQFDLSGTRNTFNTQFGAGQWNLGSVNLQLTATPNGNTVFNDPVAGQFQIFWMQNDSWTEGTGTPATPSASGINYNTLLNTFISGGDESLGTFSYNGATSGATSYSLNLTPGFRADLEAGNNVSLRMAAVDGSGSYLFNSRSFGTTANRPLLTVSTVPEPGALTLGALALAAVIVGNKTVHRKKA